jgi:hypothetical protein
MFGNAIPKIIISEKSITAPKLADEPKQQKLKKELYINFPFFLYFQKKGPRFHSVIRPRNHR